MAQVQNVACTISCRTEVPGVLLSPSFPCLWWKWGREILVQGCFLTEPEVLYWSALGQRAAKIPSEVAVPGRTWKGLSSLTGPGEFLGVLQRLPLTPLTDPVI